MSQIDTIKAKVSPADAGRHYGLKISRSGMVHCPFHNDTNPSMKLYTSAREILRNSTFPRHAAKCERAICKQSIASSAENRCNQEQPSITSNGVVLGFFYVAFRGFFRG